MPLPNPPYDPKTLTMRPLNPLPRIPPDFGPITLGFDNNSEIGSPDKSCPICGYTYDKESERVGRCKRFWQCPECEKQVCCFCFVEHSHCSRRMCEHCVKGKGKDNSDGKFTCNICGKEGYWRSIHRIYHEKS